MTRASRSRSACTGAATDETVMSWAGAEARILSMTSCASAREVEPLQLPLAAVEPQPRRIEEVLDQPVQPVHLPLDDDERLGLRRIALLEQLRVGLDDGERRLELVRGGGEELVAELVEPLRGGDVAQDRHRELGSPAGNEHGGGA